MEKIKIFYHLFACTHEYRLWLDEQLGLIRDSGLLKLSKVDISITHSNDINVPEVEDYLTRNFKDVVGRIKSVPANTVNFYEGHTLDEIYKFACENEGYKILYFHSKGISKASPESKIHFDPENFPCKNIYNRRRHAQDFCIRNHEKCIENLDKYDVVGPYFELEPVPNFEVNFWWANSSHIKNLQPPLTEHRYSANIKWDTLGRFSAWRYRRARKRNIFVLNNWNRAACSFWICNNTVLPDGTIVSKLPRIKTSYMFYNIKELLVYLLDSLDRKSLASSTVPAGNGTK